MNHHKEPFPNFCWKRTSSTSVELVFKDEDDMTAAIERLRSTRLPAVKTDVAGPTMNDSVTILRAIARRRIQYNGQVSLTEVRRRYRNVTNQELSLDAITSALGPEFKIDGANEVRWRRNETNEVRWR